MPHHRPLLAPLACLALTLAGAGCSDAPAGRTIVLVSLDSVRGDALDFSADFPHLAELAGRATRFDQAIAASSWTLPTHATMFTGAPPQLHGVEFDDLSIDPQWPTLPQLLKDAGWRTYGWYTGWYTAGEFGFARGFDAYQNAMTGGPALDRELKAHLDRGEVERAKDVLAAREVMGHRDITTPNVMAGVETVLEGVRDGEDVFLFTHLFDPHYDYIPPAPFDTQFDPDYAGAIDGRDFYQNRRIYDASKKPARQISARDLEHVEALYRGEIAYVDDQLGRLFDALEAAGRLEGALIVVTADHGEEFFEHGGRGHRNSLYDEVLHVPLLVADPRHPTPRTVSTQVSQVDLMPTILGFAGLPAPATSLGQDLAPALRGEPLDERPVLSSLMQHHPEFGYMFLETWRTSDAKLERRMQLGKQGLKLVDWRLYDLAADPAETKSVHPVSMDPRDLPAWQGLVRDLEAVRQVWQAAPRTAPEERSTALREVISGELGALGYLGEEGAPPPDNPLSPGLALPWPPGPRPKLEPVE